MSFRLYGVSLTWAILLCIVLTGIYFPALSDGSSFLARFSIQYFFGFGLLSFNICSTLKKQTRYNIYKRKAFLMSIVISIGIAALIEFIAMFIYPDRSFQWFWNFCGILGIGTGIGAFRLLYDKCC